LTRPRGPGAALGDGWRAAIGLVLLIVVLFSDAVLRGRVFYERDLHLDWYTQMEAFVRSVAAGSWPVWDTTISFGQPLLADPSAQILYPLTWLNLVLQPWRYYTVFVVVHCLFGGLGLYYLLRRARASFLGAILAAAVWICSGPLLSMLNTWQHFAAASWLGWVLLATHWAADEPGLARAAGWGAVLAGQVFAGSADVCAMSWVFAGGYLAGRLDWRRPLSRANRRLVACGAAAGAVALALSAAVWLPVLDVARRSSRWDYPESVREAWSLQPATLAGLLLPARVEDLPSSLPPPLAPTPEPREPLLPSLYLGLATVPLTLGALLRRRRPGGLFAATVVVGLLVAVGSHSPFYPFIIRILPPLSIFRYPSKAMLLVAFAWAGLAGLGIDALGDLGAALRRAIPLAWSVAVVALVFVESRLPATPAWGKLLVSGACAVAAALCIGRQRASTARLPPWATGAALLAVADVLVVHRGMNRTAPAELLAFRPPLVDAVAATDRSRIYVYDYMAPGKSLRYLGRDDPYMILTPPKGAPIDTIRVLSQRLYLFPPVGGRWGLEGSFDLDFRGLYPLPLARLVALVRRVEGTPGLVRLLRIGAVRSVVALHTQGFGDLARVETIPSYYPEPIYVLRVPDPLPRAYAVDGAREARGDAALATLLDPTFDPFREIILPRVAQRETPDTRFEETVRIVAFKPDRVTLEAQTTGPAYVVLVDSYDPGWRATVDRVPAPVLRANVAFRAVQVPGGRHVVEFVYRPPAVSWGLSISALTAIFLAGAWAREALRHRRENAAGGDREQR
jgi:Bacterial membrane protein YfhO